MKQVFTNLDESDYVGDLKSEPKRRGRKSKKQNEKEIMYDFKKEHDNEENVIKHEKPGKK